MDALREIFRPLPSGVLLVLLGACVAVAVAWFVWNRIRALAWLAKCHNLALALLLGAMAAMGVHRGFAKLPQNYGIEELWNYGNEALGIVGEAQFHNATLTQLTIGSIKRGWISSLLKRAVVGREASMLVTAHELGHLLGLDDCYTRTRLGELIEEGNEPIQQGYFSTSGQDWWLESGRGFYSLADDLESIAAQMLMHGEDTGYGRDIPGQWFKSLRRDTLFEDDKVEALVGAEFINRNQEEVYRR